MVAVLSIVPGISWWTTVSYFQHFCDFHGKPIIINQITWHGCQVAKAMPQVYVHKSLKTPNKLCTKNSYNPPPGNFNIF